MKKFLYFILFLVACGRSSNEQLINFFLNEKENSIYLSLVLHFESIQTLNSSYRIHYYPNIPNHLVLQRYQSSDTIFHEDFILSQNYSNNIAELEITNILVVKKEEVCFSYFEKKNIDGGNVFLIYLFKGFEKSKEQYIKDGYKLYKGNQRPKENSKWIYQIDENWIIYSQPDMRPPSW